jgi:hypothetical protein
MLDRLQGRLKATFLYIHELGSRRYLIQNFALQYVVGEHTVVAVFFKKNSLYYQTNIRAVRRGSSQDLPDIKPECRGFFSSIYIKFSRTMDPTGDKNHLWCELAKYRRHLRS